MEEASDAELVLRCQSRDLKAFEELILRYTPLTRGLIRAFLGPTREVEDILQEVFFQALKSLPRLREPEKFNSWLYKITQRVSHAWVRGRTGMLPLEEEGAVEAREEESLDDRQARESALEDVRRVVQGLPDIYREVVLLRYYSRADYQSMARTLGLTPSAVNARLVKARKMLRTRLESLRREGRFHGV